jgi:hypothetical protein
MFGYTFRLNLAVIPAFPARFDVEISTGILRFSAQARPILMPAGVQFAVADRDDGGFPIHTDIAPKFTILLDESQMESLFPTMIYDEDVCGLKAGKPVKLMSPARRMIDDCQLSSTRTFLRRTEKEVPPDVGWLVKSLNQLQAEIRLKLWKDRERGNCAEFRGR